MTAIYTGRPGAGKSYGVVENVIVPAIEKGRRVVTNIPMRTDKLVERFGAKGTNVVALPELDGRIDYANMPNGAVIVIDEASTLFPSGMQANKIPDEVKDFFSMHRHKTDEQGNSQQIVLITQHVSDLAAFVRNRIDHHYRATKLSVVGKPDSYRIDVFDGANEEKKKQVRQIMGSYKPEVYALYHSHTMGQGEGSPTGEASIDDRANVFKAGAIRYGVPLGVIAWMLAGYMGYAAISGFGARAEDQRHVVEARSAPEPQAQRKTLAPASVQPQQAKQVQVTHAEPASPKLSTEWRLVAHIRSEDRELFVAEGKGGLRNLHENDCEEKNGQYWCLLEGEFVTEFSGFPLKNDLGFAPQNAGVVHQAM
jgi:zona occludens toxin